MPCFFVGGIKCSRYFGYENDPSLFPNGNSSSKVNFQFERKAGWFVFISPWFAWPPNWPALVFYRLHVYSYKWLPRITYNLHALHSLQSRQLLTKMRVFLSLQGQETNRSLLQRRKIPCSYKKQSIRKCVLRDLTPKATRSDSSVISCR